jgi:hypothetical protein
MGVHGLNSLAGYERFLVVFMAVAEPVSGA